MKATTKLKPLGCFVRRARNGLFGFEDDVAAVEKAFGKPVVTVERALDGNALGRLLTTAEWPIVHLECHFEPEGGDPILSPLDACPAPWGGAELQFSPCRTTRSDSHPTHWLSCASRRRCNCSCSQLVNPRYTSRGFLAAPAWWHRAPWSLSRRPLSGLAASTSSSWRGRDSAKPSTLRRWVPASP